MIKKLLSLIKVLIFFTRYIIAYGFLIFIWKYDLFSNILYSEINENTINFGFFLAYFLTFGLLIKTILAFFLGVETAETKVVKDFNSLIKDKRVS